MFLNYIVTSTLIFKFIKIFRSEFFVQLLPIPAGVILSRLLGPSDRGQLAEILLIPSLLATVISCNWDKFLKGEIINSRTNNNPIYEQTFYLYIAQIILVSFIAIIMNFFGLWAAFLTPLTALLFSFIIVTLQLGSNYVVAISSCALDSNIIYKYKLYGVTAYLFCISLFLLHGSIGINAAFATNQIVPLISIFLLFSLFNMTLFKLEFKFRFDFNFIIGKFKNLHYVLLDTISNSIDVLLMVKFASHGEVGAYLSFKILEFPFRLFNLSCVALITPIFSDFNFKLVGFSKLIGVLFLTTFAFYGLFLPVLDKLIIYMLGVKFIDFLWMTKFVITIGVFQNFYFLLLNFLILNNNIIGYNRVVLFTSILRILLSVILFVHFGVEGIFFSLILSPIFGILFIYYAKLLGNRPS